MVTKQDPERDNSRQGALKLSADQRHRISITDAPEIPDLKFKFPYLKPDLGTSFRKFEQVPKNVKKENDI